MSSGAAPGGGPAPSAGPPPGTARRPARHGARGPDKKAKARLIASGIVIALIVVFAILNLGKVKVDWIVATTHTSLTIVIVVAFLLGALTGGLLVRRRMTR